MKFSNYLMQKLVEWRMKKQMKNCKQNWDSAHDSLAMQRHQKKKDEGGKA